MKRLISIAVAASLVSACAPSEQETPIVATAPVTADGTAFRVDPFWPLPLRDDSLLGSRAFSDIANRSDLVRLGNQRSNGGEELVAVLSENLPVEDRLR